MKNKQKEKQELIQSTTLTIIGAVEDELGLGDNDGFSDSEESNTLYVKIQESLEKFVAEIEKLK